MNQKNKNLIQQESKQMVIDYFEFLVLVEACWHVGTILRHSIIVKAMDVWYHALTKNERVRAFESFERNLNCSDDIHHRIMARFDPEKQYKVFLKNGDYENQPLCYLFLDEYWTSSFQCVNKDFITKVKPV